MKWRRRGKMSGNIIDRRGAPGIGGGPGLAIGGLGIPGLIILALVFFLNRGGTNIDSSAFDDLQGGDPRAEAPLEGPDPDARLVGFMSFVLDDVQNFWEDTFAASNQEYPRADLVLFEAGTQSACGGATEQIGPHYCPPDQNVYIDLDFFKDLRDDFGAPGDFAQAYVLAHEIAHHVQNVMGINEDVRREQEANPDAANDLSIRLELQADCLAGVWAFTAYERDLLESGDLREGLDAAAAVGDDRLQEAATGEIDRESWTHGSSEQRVEWFTNGYEDGDPNACDTFSVDEP
jgi:predicted metalloprotease